MIEVDIGAERARYFLERRRNPRALHLCAALTGTLLLALGSGACASSARTSQATQGPREATEPTSSHGVDITVQIDDRGIPHIHASSDAALSYGLGFVHAQDRLFQLLVLRHAAAGRLSEILGEDHLEQDRRLRLLSWRIDDAVAALADRDREILQAYVDGVQTGSQAQGPSADQRFLGLDFPAMQIADVLRIARLHAWEMDAGLEEELARARIIARLPTTDARLQELLAPVPSGDVSIVAPKLGHLAAPQSPELENHNGQPVWGVDDASSLRSSVRTLHWRKGETWRKTKSFLGLGPGNAWALSGAHTQSGAPILASSPHGIHRSPALLYQVHLVHPAFTWHGATLPGMPLLLTGQSQHLAWSASASFADTQDLVRMPDAAKTSASNPNLSLGLHSWRQEFRVGRKVRLREIWQTTSLGPILPPAYAPFQEVGAQHALLWTGFLPEALSNHFSGHFDLAKARSLTEADVAIEKLGIPSTNLLLAFTDGTIAYRLAGILFHRDKNAPHDRPGLLRNGPAFWRERLRETEKARVDRPFSGLLVSANQRIVSDEDVTSTLIGHDSALPYRALRIHQLLQERLQKGPLTVEDMTTLQKDVVSPEAQRLAPILAAHCPLVLPPHRSQTLAIYCERLGSFDGSFTVESTGALPYIRLKEALFAEILATHLGEDVVSDLVGVPFIDGILLHAIEAEHQGKPHPLLDDRRSAAREGLAVFVARATHNALQRLQQEGWPLLEKWGEFHRFRSRPFWPIAPLVTAFWDAVDLPQDGSRHAICTESEGEITQGALLRYVAEMRSEAEGAMILDGEQQSAWPGAVLSPVHRDWQRGILRPLRDLPTQATQENQRVWHLWYPRRVP